MKAIISKIKEKQHVCMIYITCMLIMTATIGNPVSASTYSDNIDVNFTFNPSMTISLSSSDLVINNLVPGTSSDSNTVVVNVETNNVTGYSLSATVGSSTNATTSLTHTSSNNNFTSLSTDESITDPSSFNPNTWGYSYYLSDSTTWSDYNGTPSYSYRSSTWSNYSGLPLYTNPGTILSEKYNSANDSISFKIAAKSSTTQASGTYNNVINFTTVANPEVRYYMQEFTNDMCRTLATDDNYAVYDYRDGNDYTVRYINGNCWMTQNLRVDGTISAQYSNFAGNDFNISQGDLDQTAGTCSGTECNSYTMPMTHNSGNTTNGVWYNYCAATAGEVCQRTTKQNATQDVCPDGWKMPTEATFLSIFDYAPMFNPTKGGNFSSGMKYYSNAGYWWNASGMGTDSSGYVYYVDSLIKNGGIRTVGRNIRCIANN